LPVQLPSQWQAEEIYAAMASDKKKATGRLRFVLPRDIGDVFVSDQVSEDQVLKTLRHCGAK
jgi:3-dehydroquinate synthase